jgi:hypothetical protein
MEVKTGTVVSVAPEDPEAIVVVDINGKAVSIAEDLREVRGRNLERGDAVSLAFDELGAAAAILW